jgi:hypothetical protein
VGQRANLIVARDQGYELFYCHWCANTLPCDLFWGPRHAMAFIRSQRRVDEDDWLDDVWAEGGALIDPDHRILILFGGDDLRSDVPVRRVYLDLLRQVWAGWDIRWAHEGIVDLADYVGCPSSKVLSDVEDRATGLEPPLEKGWTTIVASVRFADGALRLYPLPGRVREYLEVGSTLLDHASKPKGFERFPPDGWTLSFPDGGFHIDARQRQLSFWIANAVSRIVPRVEAIWPGWAVLWEKDRFEGQLERTDGALKFPNEPTDKLRAQVVQMLLARNEASPVDSLLQSAARKRAEGKSVEINAFALRHDPLVLPREVRLGILRSIGLEIP